MTGPQLYVLFQFLALATSLAAAALFRDREPLPWRRRLALWLGAVAGAGVGARLPFAILAAEPLFSAGAWLTDGKTVLSGLAGGYLGVEIAKLAASVRRKTGDLFAIPLAAGLAVGRWGCYFNG
jgi:prolipoprotein diacylglyceryltransferase